MANGPHSPHVKTMSEIETSIPLAAGQPPGYGWHPIPPDFQDRPVVILDLDGSLRGDVMPMVRLARPLVPKFTRKIMLREPLGTKRLLRFIWNLTSLWTLRTIHYEQRRRYKHLFSELHHLAAAMLQDMSLGEVRRMYCDTFASTPGLWWPDAVRLLRRLTREANLLIVTGSEQLQTEECVKLLAGHGVLTNRIFVRGSLYDFNEQRRRFTGRVKRLNVTLEGKRDAVQAFGGEPGGHVLGALGNSRPDRALFKAVAPGGFCVLVCPESVIQERKETTFVIRKLHRNGFRIYWEVPEFLDAVDQFEQNQFSADRPVLATDCYFTSLLRDSQLKRAFLKKISRADEKTAAALHTRSLLGAVEKRSISRPAFPDF